MIDYKCYRLKELLKLLGEDFHVINKESKYIFSDWCTGDEDFKYNDKFYITTQNNIKEIIEWSSLWTKIVVKCSDDTKLELHSNNINPDDDSLLRISKNNFISPAFERQDNYILANKELDEWLLFNGVSQSSLDDISVVFQLYPTYVFKGLYEPIIENGEYRGYYGKDMKLSEDKIDKALSDIKDAEARIKFERIIKSFECKYE